LSVNEQCLLTEEGHYKERDLEGRVMSESTVAAELIRTTSSF